MTAQELPIQIVQRAATLAGSAFDRMDRVSVDRLGYPILYSEPEKLVRLDLADLRLVGWRLPIYTHHHMIGFARISNPSDGREPRFEIERVGTAQNGTNIALSRLGGVSDDELNASLSFIDAPELDLFLIVLVGRQPRFFDRFDGEEYDFEAMRRQIAARFEEKSHFEPGSDNDPDPEPNGNRGPRRMSPGD